MTDRIRIRMFGLIHIRMPVGCPEKCRGCIILSALVISPSMALVNRPLIVCTLTMLGALEVVRAAYCAL